MPNLTNRKQTRNKVEKKTVVNTVVKHKSEGTNKLDPKLHQNVSVKLEKCKDLEDRLQAASVKSVQFNHSNINNPTTPTFEKTVRRRETKNYVESSLSDDSCVTLEKSDCSTKLPVYLQNNLSNELKPKMDDPFEFVPDSPKTKKGRGKKDVCSGALHHLRKGKHNVDIDDDSSDSDSDVYDKSMHTILKDVRKKEKKKKLLNKKQTQQKNKMNNLQKKIVAASEMNVQASNINDVAVRNVSNVTRKLTNREIIGQLTKQIKHLSQNISLFSDSFDIKSKKDENSDDHKYFGFNEEDDEDDAVTMLPSSAILPIQKTNMRRLLSMKPVNENISRQFTSLTSTPISVTRKKNTKKSLEEKQISVAAVASSSLDSISEIIPETESLLSNKQTTSNNDLGGTKKLSSTLFSTPSLENGFRGFDNNIRPIQNRLSIKEMNVMNNQESLSINQMATPWRSDNLSVRRNPHLLYLKNTSLLPSYNQDMVLNSEWGEKTLHHQTSIHQINRIKSKIQTSILDFVNTNTSRISMQRTPVKKNHNQTLFDEGDFSPIKLKSTTESNKNVSSPLESSNIINIPTKKLTDKFGIENYFNSDSPDVHKENKMVVNEKDQNNAPPMRVPAKILKGVQDELAENLVENNVNDGLEIIGLEAVEEKNEAPYFGLFDNLKEIKSPKYVYSRKRTKRVQLTSVDSEENEKEERPKRKHKETAAAEEEEFNKWAAQFNAMCENVDKHDLETA